MLRASTINECLTNPKVISPLLVSIKGTKRLILDLSYVNNDLFKDKIKFDDLNSFQNYLEGTKGYLFQFDQKKVYYHFAILMNIKHILALTGKLTSKHIILSLLSYLLD